MNDYMSFICDNVDENIFQKYSFIAANCSDELYIACENYQLNTYIVFIKNTLSNFLSSKRFKITFSITEAHGDKVLSDGILLEDTLPQNITNNNNKLIIARRITLVIPRECNIIFRLEIDSNCVCMQKYIIKYGEAPLVKANGYITSGGVLIPGDNNISIQELFSRSITELFINDCYMPPDSLLDLINNVNQSSNIKLITLYKFYKDYKNKIDLLKNSGFNNIEIRFSNCIHDRYVLIDNSELYHFGYSFKDLDKKVSSFEKIDRKQDYKRLMELFIKTWEASKSKKIVITNI